MGNEVVLKIGMGTMKMHGFYGNPLYESQEWGVGLQIKSYLGLEY